MTIITTDSTAVRPNILIRKRQAGFAFMILDAAGSINMLSSSVMDEFEERIEEAASDPSIKAIGIISGKPESFLLGADLHEILKFTHVSQAEELSRRGQRMFNRLVSMGKPTVVGIHGACLGGGTELALCCHKRVATISPATQIGLPEVKLGFVPGLGGTQRLPRLIGLRSALDLILSAEPISAKEALKLGLVDRLTDADSLLDVVEQEALALLQNWQSYKQPDRLGELSQEKQKSLFAMIERAVRIKTKGNYPAQTRVLDVMKIGIEQGIERGLDEEAKTFAELAVGDVSHNLVFLFFTAEFARQSAMAAAKKAGTAPVSKIGIIGGGLMGTAIAELAAQKGLHVLFRAANKERQKLALEKINEILQRSDKRQEDGQAESLTINALEDDGALADVDLVVEACAEDMAIKSEVFAGLAKVIPSDCVIATNTSSLSIANLAKAIPQGTQLMGMHFFYPVDRMPLVEVIAAPGASKESIARINNFLAQLGKIPVHVKDSPCFLVNRVLYCYLSEVASLAVEKTPINWIEEAAINFGMPLGPMALLDEVGLDVANMVARSLNSAFGERLKAPDELAQALELGLIGKKTGSGIYDWDESGKKLGFDKRVIENLGFIVTENKIDPETSNRLSQRMVLPMVDEAARCLEEKVVRRAREIDLCTVLGMGFPPFRGGLLRYADSLGLPYVIKTLQEIYQAGAIKREVSPFLLKLAQENRGFYARGQGDEA